MAACSISLFCCCKPRALSSVTLLSSSAADASWVAEPAINCRVSRSLSCMRAMARSRRAASSVPSARMTWVRSPSATCSAHLSASSIGLTMLRVSRNAHASVNKVAAINRPITSAKADAYWPAAVSLVARVWSVLMRTRVSMTLLICSELANRSRLSRPRSSSVRLAWLMLRMRASSWRYWLSSSVYWSKAACSSAALISGR
ncbi:hypothetical protein D3C81_1493600 [compost metagenome]